MPMPAAALAEAARQYEALGLEGLWAPQLYGPPFVPLAAAAMVTERVKLGSGVALAFVRSPLETACAALDLDRISGGRCVLRIGPSVRWWNEDWYGVHYGKPIPHLREAVSVIRRLLREGHTGTLGRFEGEYYRLNLDRFRTLAPPVRTDLPIYLPAVYETAIRVAGEIADGLAGHPIWCERWILERVPRNLEAGLARSGRSRGEFDLNLWLWVAPGPDKGQCIEDARSTVMFYALHRQYERYFDQCGYGEQARAIADASERKDPEAMRSACPDEMVETFALVGPPDEVRRRVERLASVADSFTLCPPISGLAPEQVAEYGRRIAETFYA
jgi:probable F420-dependent oxidoreductase